MHAEQGARRERALERSARLSTIARSSARAAAQRGALEGVQSNTLQAAPAQHRLEDQRALAESALGKHETRWREEPSLDLLDSVFDERSGLPRSTCGPQRASRRPASSRRTGATHAWTPSRGWCRTGLGAAARRGRRARGSRAVRGGPRASRGCSPRWSGTRRFASGSSSHCARLPPSGRRRRGPPRWEARGETEGAAQARGRGRARADEAAAASLAELGRIVDATQAELGGLRVSHAAQLQARSGSSGPSCTRRWRRTWRRRTPCSG